MVVASGSGSLGSLSAARETSRRPLRIFPFDPMVDRFRDPVVCRVPFEAVVPGPIGRLVEVVDEGGDRGQRGRRDPIDLDAPAVLIAQGLTPSETDYRFRQQMAYAVVMRTLEEFERGLGRPIVWEGLRRLRVSPDGDKNANAWFDGNEFKLVFGYFRAIDEDPGTNLPGQIVYTCLSYDVVAHQATHPVLEQLRPYAWVDDDGSVAAADSNAFYEGMADLIALLVRFGEPEVVANTIRDHGVSFKDSPLLQMGRQFGQAAGMGSTMRSFPDEAKPETYQTEMEPHARGKLLASAVLEAMIGAYREQTGDLLRLNGGEPVAGYVHPDLVNRLADEATTLATGVLRALIAAIDYLPPAELQFHDVLRAFLLTDTMLFGRSHHRFRALLIGSFHARGLVLSTVGSLAIDALLLPPAEGLIDEPLPHAGDALLHTITAVEWGRLSKSQHGGTPSVVASLLRQQADRAAVWMPAIEQFATRHAQVLGFDDARPIEAYGLAGSNQVGAGGNLVARVFVTLRQPMPPGARGTRGVTLVCDSNGDVRYAIGLDGPVSRPKSARRTPAPKPAKRAR
jgi:hypothetical protein